MSIKKRFMEHLAECGKIPKKYAHGGKMYSMGGMVSDEDEWEDGDYNDHTDTSGEPVTYGQSYMKEYAFGGKVQVPEKKTPMPSMSGKQYAKPNFAGPERHEQEDDMMSDEEIRKHMVMAIKSKRGRY